MGVLPPQIKIRKVNFAVALLVTTVLGISALGYLPWPVCPFHTYLGVDCSMCGTTHAVLSLFQGHIQAALISNPFFWLWTLWALVSYLDLWHRTIQAEATLGERALRWAMANPWSRALHIVAFASMLFYRNIHK